MLFMRVGEILSKALKLLVLFITIVCVKSLIVEQFFQS